MAKSVVLKNIDEGCFHDLALVRTGVDACLRGHLKSTGQTVVLKPLSPNCCHWLSRLKDALALGRLCVKQILLPLGVYSSRSLTGLVWDWMPEGSLNSLLFETRLYPELPIAIRLQILLEVAEGLNHLHAIPLPHGALKTTNVLLDHQFHAKLCDWGQTTVLNERTHLSKRYNPCVRDLTYLAPEVIQGNMPSVQADMYSFGVLIWELLNRRPACEANDQLQTLVFAQSGKQPVEDHKLLPPETPQCSALTQLMIRCWSTLPKQRPLAKECEVELRKALEKLDLDAYYTAVHLLQTCKKRALLGCKHTPSEELPIELNNLESCGGSKILTSKIIPVNVAYSNKPASWVIRSDETVWRKSTVFPATARASPLMRCCRDTTNNPVGSSSSFSNNPVRECVWSATPSQATSPPNTPSGSPTSLIVNSIQHPSAENQDTCPVSSRWTCCRLLQERREAIVHFMTEGRFNNLLDVLRARQAVTREDYEIITAPMTLSGRIRCLLDTCVCLGENVSVLVATTLGLISRETTRGFNCVSNMG